MSEKADWFAVDWGTSNLRVWAMAGSDRVIDTFRSNRGMNALAPEDFETAFLDIVAPALSGDGRPVRLIACGMVGARQGWVEAAYLSVPCRPPDAARAVLAPSPKGLTEAHVLPGLSQNSPPDVMRGEETQIAGFLSRRPDFDGVLVLPGTHTKWAHLSAGEIVSFRTFMTGELFSLLADKSVLRHSVGQDDIDETAFNAALTDGLSRPEGLAAGLFGIRAASLLSALSPAAARGRLSGLLLGAELAAARPYWLGREVAVVGEKGLAALYARGLAAQGVTAGVHAAGELTLAGLCAAYAQLGD